MADRSNTPFEQWALAEGVPIVRGYYVPDAYKVALAPWKRTGGQGAIIILEGGEGFSNAYIAEISPGVSLKPEKHLFEEKLYVLQGNGEARFWNEGGPSRTIAWQEYSLFSPPVNVWHELRNTGDQPAKIVAVTDAPLVFNMYRNPRFVFNSGFVFRDRYDDEPDYFDGVGRMVDRQTWAGGFIQDVRKPYLGPRVEHGPGYGVVQVELSRNGMGTHVAQIDVGSYKKPHRHAAGAHLIVVEGTGYALMWDTWDRRVKADFQKGTIYCPPEGWFHTHCNTGAQVVKHVALRCGIPGIGKIYQQRLSIKHGGDMLDRDEEDPAVKRLFEEEMKKAQLAREVSN
ncbi:MAG: cupin domain-containing protein [Chloroflexi bacterium]|nr:cupin domain-containing protein [Chloroflexota bacterium]